MSSVGVDIVEMKKARSLYQLCRKDLSRVLTPAEISYLKSSRHTLQTFALLLAAKEAVFKWLGAVAWMGISGFREIGVTISKDRGPIQVTLTGSMKRLLNKRSASTRFYSLKRRQYVVALAVS